MATPSNFPNSWENSSASFSFPPASGVRVRDYRGLWVALTNCTFDPVTKKPVEGDIVDCDRDFSALSGRMRQQGLCSCAIVFCDKNLHFESQPPPAMGER